jgi:hypothetical protein
MFTEGGKNYFTIREAYFPENVGCPAKKYTTSFFSCEF